MFVSSYLSHRVGDCLKKKRRADATTHTGYRVATSLARLSTYFDYIQFLCTNVVHLT